MTTHRPGTISFLRAFTACDTKSELRSWSRHCEQLLGRNLARIGYESGPLITKRIMNTRRRAFSKARMSCMSCREQKLKCDRSQPRCSRCTKRGDKCTYPTTRRRQTEPRRTIPELEARLGKANNPDETTSANAMT